MPSIKTDKNRKLIDGRYPVIFRLNREELRTLNRLSKEAGNRQKWIKTILSQ